MGTFYPEINSIEFVLVFIVNFEQLFPHLDTNSWIILPFEDFQLFWFSFPSLLKQNLNNVIWKALDSEVYERPCDISMIEIFRKNSKQLFTKKSSSQVFDSVLNTPLRLAASQIQRCFKANDLMTIRNTRETSTLKIYRQSQSKYIECSQCIQLEAGLDQHPPSSFFIITIPITSLALFSYLLQLLCC